MQVEGMDSMLEQLEHGGAKETDDYLKLLSLEEGEVAPVNDVAAIPESIKQQIIDIEEKEKSEKE